MKDVEMRVKKQVHRSVVLTLSSLSLSLSLSLFLSLSNMTAQTEARLWQAEDGSWRTHLNLTLASPQPVALNRLLQLPLNATVLPVAQPGSVALTYASHSGPVPGLAAPALAGLHVQAQAPAYHYPALTALTTTGAADHVLVSGSLAPAVNLTIAPPPDRAAVPVLGAPVALQQVGNASGLMLTLLGHSIPVDSTGRVELPLSNTSTLCANCLTSLNSGCQPDLLQCPLAWLRLGNACIDPAQVSCAQLVSALGSAAEAAALAPHLWASLNCSAGPAYPCAGAPPAQQLAWGCGSAPQCVGLLHLAPDQPSCAYLPHACAPAAQLAATANVSLGVHGVVPVASTMPATSAASDPWPYAVAHPVALDQSVVLANARFSNDTHQLTASVNLPGVAGPVAVNGSIDQAAGQLRLQATRPFDWVTPLGTVANVSGAWNVSLLHPNNVTGAWAGHVQLGNQPFAARATYHSNLGFSAFALTPQAPQRRDATTTTVAAAVAQLCQGQCQLGQLPAPVVQHIENCSVTGQHVQLRRSPPALLLTAQAQCQSVVNGSVTPFTADLAVLAARPTNASSAYGLALSLNVTSTPAISAGAIVSSSAPALPLSNVQVLVSNIPAAAAAATPALGSFAVPGTPGLSLNAHVAIGVLPAAAQRVWPSTSVLQVDMWVPASSAGAPLQLAVTLPAAGRLATGVVLQQGSLVYQTSAVVAVSGVLSLAAPNSAAPVVVGAAGNWTPAALTLQGSVTQLTLGDMTIESASVAVTLKANDTAASGSLAGDVLLHGVTLQAAFDVPLTSLDVSAANVQLGPDVLLTNLSLADDLATHTVTVAGQAQLALGAGRTLALAVTGTAEAGRLSHLQGTTTLALAPSTNLTLAADITPGANTLLSGTLHLPGLQQAQVTAQLPLNASQGVLSAAVQGWQLLPGLTLVSGSVTLDMATSTLSAAGLATAQLGSQQAQFQVSLTLNHATGALTLSGTAQNVLQLDSFQLTQLGLQLASTPPAGNATAATVTGAITASMDLLSVQDLQVRIPIPLRGNELDLSVAQIVVSPQLTLSDLSLDLALNDQGQASSATMAGTCIIGAQAAAIHVTGAVSSTDLQFTGQLASLVVPVGRDNLTLTNLQLSVNKPAAGPASGSLQGQASLANVALAARLDFPTTELAVNLTLVNPHDALTLADVIGATVSQPAATVPPPAQAPALVQAVTGQTLEQVSVQVVLQPPARSASLQLQAVVPWAEQQAQVALAFALVETNSSWHYLVALDLQKYTPVHVLGAAAPAALSQVPMTNVVGALTDLPGPTCRVPALPAFPTLSHLIHTSLQPGLTLVGAVPVAYIEQTIGFDKFMPAAGSGPALTATLFYPVFTPTTQDLTIAVDLPQLTWTASGGQQNITLSNAECQIAVPVSAASTAALAFSVGAQLSLGLDGTLPPMVFAVRLSERAGVYQVSGLADDPYHFSIGHLGVQAARLALNATFTAANDQLVGTVAGSTELANVDFALSITLAADAAVSVAFTVSNEAAVDFQALVDSVDGTLSLPTFGGVATHPMYAARVAVTLHAPLTLTVEAVAKGLWNLPESAAKLQLTAASTCMAAAPSWAFGVQVGTGFSLAALQSGWQALDRVKDDFTGGGIVLSSEAQAFALPGLPAEPAVAGVTVYLNLAFTNQLAIIQDWTHVSQLFLKATLPFDGQDLHLVGNLTTDWQVGSHLSITNAYVFLDFPGTQALNSFDFGLGADIAVSLGPLATPNNALDFFGQIMFLETGLMLQAGMSDNWVDPFHLPGITLEHCEIEVGWVWGVPVPHTFGISGGLQIGPEQGSATFLISAIDPTNFVMAGTLNELSLPAMVGALTHDQAPAWLDAVLDVSFEGLQLSLCLDPAGLTFNEFHYPPGLVFDAQQFDLWGLQGSANISVWVDRVSVRAETQPFALGSALQVHGFSSATAPVLVDIGLGADVVDDHFIISADAEFLDVMQLGMLLNVSAAGLQAGLRWELAGVFNLTGLLQATKQDTDGRPIDFSLQASLGLEFAQNLESALLKLINGFRDEVNAKLNDAKAALASWEAANGPKMQADQAAINAKEAAISQAQSAAETNLQQKEAALKSSQSCVDYWEQTKAGHEAQLRTCHWYDVGCDAHNAWLHTEMAYDDARIAIHNAAVDVAEAALKVAQGAVDAFYDVDKAANPDVLALRADQAALAVLSEAEKGLQAAITVAQDGITGVAKAMDDFVGVIFALRSVSISAGSTNGLAQGDAAQLSVDIDFLGSQKQYTVDFHFPPKFDDILQSVWATLKSDLGL